MLCYNILLPALNLDIGLLIALYMRCNYLIKLIILAIISTHSWVQAAPRVVVSIPPLHSLVSSLMEGVGEPELLLPAGSSPHRYAMKPSAIRSLRKADLVISIGPEYETFLSKTLASLPNPEVVVSLANTAHTHRLPTREGGVWRVGNENEHSIHSKKWDMHLWLDVENASHWIDVIAAKLVSIDPTHVRLYRLNAGELLQRLRLLDEEIRRKLEPVRAKPYLVFHDAYQYFEKRYGLNPVGAISAATARAPGAKRLSEIRRLVSRGRAHCLFSEPQFEPHLIRTLADGQELRVGLLDPLGARLKPGKDQYFKLLHSMADSLSNCLTG